MMRWTYRLLAASLVIAALSLALERPAPANAETLPNPQNYGAIVRTALASVNQQRGECFPWVKSVVQAAIGKAIGYDYNLGYLQAGATEVPLLSARDGDIIQIDNPAITVPNADYPGLHTAIVIDNLGNGDFRVIDSNMNFDGVVHVREGYNPAKLSARAPGLVVRVYRFAGGASGTTPVRLPSSVAPAPTVAPPSIVANGALPTAGASVRIAADNDCLRVRGSAGLVGAVLGCLPTGASATITQVGPNADGYRWIQVSAGALTGWVAGEYLAAGNASIPVNTTPAAVTPVVTPAAPAPPPAPPRGVFAASPQFSTSSRQAAAVFMGGSADQLIGAATDAKATGVWVQDPRGAFQLLIVGGPSFMVDAFRTTFAAPFAGPVAVTLIGAA